MALEIAGTDTGGFFTFDMIVVEPCGTATINQDILNTIFLSLMLTQFVTDSAGAICWADTDVTESLLLICGPLAYSILDRSGNPIDSSIFDDSIDPHFLYFETSDPSNTHTYDLQILIPYVNV